MRISRLLVTSALACLAACGSDSPTGPSSHPPVDLNSILSQLASGGLSGSTATTAGVVPTAGLVTSVPSSCPYTASVGGFVCAPTTHDGVTVSMTYYLLDAAGHSQTALDANTTAAIRSVLDIAGTITTTNDSLSGTIGLTAHSDMTMSGLLTSTRVVNGTSRTHSDVNLTRPQAVRGTSDATSTTSNLTMPAQPDPAKPWPTSGTITTDATTTASGGVALPSATVTLHTVMTFNGSGIVTMTVTIGGTTSTCHLDLSGKTPTTCS